VIRALAYLIFGILLLGILRTVLGFFGQLFTNATVGPERPASRAPASPQTLKKDPVCGTFVPPSQELQKVKDGQTYYFCSAACRDKFI
jgi:YHS domain-containing protein